MFALLRKSTGAVENPAVETVFGSIEFYKEFFPRLVQLAFLLGVLLVVSFSTNIYMFTRPIDTKYLKYGTDGKVTEFVPTDEPIWDDQEIIDWATKSVLKAYVFDFRNWHTQWQESANSFSEAGWQSFASALGPGDSGTLAMVLAKKLIVSSQPLAAGVIIDRGILKKGHKDAIGKAFWMIQFPMMVRFESVSENAVINQLVTVMVRRVDTRLKPRGIVLEQVFAVPYNGN